MDKYLKFNLFILFCLFCSITVQAQVNKDLTEKEIDKELITIRKESQACWEKQNLGCALSKLQEIKHKFYLQPKEWQEKKKYFLPDVYYNMACIYSLTGKTDSAVIAFGKAIDYGYSNYIQAKQDSDLNNIRELPKFKELLASIREKGDYGYILKKAGDYVTNPTFTYQSKDAPELVRLKVYFNLDSIAGNGDEISRILNLMTWTHNLIVHDGSFMPPTERNAISFYEYAKEHNVGINCRALAIFLNECYLALGIKSRYVACLPKDQDDKDCHVINTVFSNTLNKWIWIDPAFNAYVKDENGNLLGIAEVRERLREDKPLFLNEDANWNNKNKQTKEYYLDAYMAKNLYWFSSPAESKYNTDSEKIYNKYIALLPAGYYLKHRDILTFYTLDNKFFWEE